MSGDLSMNGIYNKNKDDKDLDKNKEKDKKDEEKKKTDKDKEKEQKLKDEMKQEFDQIKDPFKPGDYFKLAKRILDNKPEMESMTNSDPALRQKTQKVFDMFNRMDGDDRRHEEYSKFLEGRKQESDETAEPSILGPSNLERHLVPQATHLDTTTE
jgi:hypothetical protein